MDPKDFVQPPYAACPACRRETFGILGIHGHSYTRRCRECWHTIDLPLPAIRKKIIYLDQCVISNIAKLENPHLQRNDRLTTETFWSELRDLLYELRRMQLIVCPDSSSHVSESRISSFNAELKRTYEHLSGGASFQPFESMRSGQIAELARAWSEGREAQFTTNPRDVLDKDIDEWSERYYLTFADNPFVLPEEIKAGRAKVQSHITELFNKEWSTERRSFEYWYDGERLGYQGHLYAAVAECERERMRLFLNLAVTAAPDFRIIEKMLPSPVEMLMKHIREIMRFPRSGSERSADEVSEMERGFRKANRISEAPFVKLTAMMFAVLAVRAGNGQKEPPNEGMTTDIETVAHLLPYCDAMFMDNECRGLLQNIPKAYKPPEVSRVFSMNRRQEFVAYLRSIRSSATAEHLGVLRDVYGRHLS